MFFKRRDLFIRKESAPLNAKILDGRKLSARILEAAHREARAVRARRGRPPQLAIISSSDPAAQSYLRAKVLACVRAGIEPVVHRLSPGPREKTLGLLIDITSDPKIDAVIVDTPYPRGLRAADIFLAIPPGKDVEGVTPEVYGRLFLAKSWDEASRLNGPCTALALARLLVESGAPLSGRTAVVVGRSATVGRPTAHLLSTLDLTVTLAHSQTRGLAGLCRTADVLVAAVGKSHMIRPDWIKPGALVLDAGVNFSRRGLTGDVSPKASARAAFLTPVPGGAGPVTTAILVLQAARLAARSRP